MKGLPSLSAANWPDTAYRRGDLPEQVLQFGTGMLLRALCAASVDAANRAGRIAGRIVVVQSTPQGNARALNAQDGLFTLVERGLENGERVERTRLIGAVSRALVAETEWNAVRAIAARPEVQVIVSNVTEAGFRIDSGFPARLTDALYARFESLPDGPDRRPLFVIPTELLPDNGPRLAAMVDELASRTARADAFRHWLSSHVRFCSSLVDRITTGLPPANERAALDAQLGYTDALLTVAEPYHLWAIEGDPAALRKAFPIDVQPESVVFAPDIGFYEERKLRLLNATHTAVTPVALLAGVRTVRDGMDHRRLGTFLRSMLFDEIIPATNLPAEAAVPFAHSVIERFCNPWLDHEWRTIATNQESKMRIRVEPVIVASTKRRQRAPERLALACAAHLTFLRVPIETLSEASRLPDFVAAVARWRTVIEHEGIEGALSKCS